MSNPKSGGLFGYASKEEALAQWRNIVDNEDLVVYEIRIGMGDVQPVAWVILKDQAA